MLQAFIITLREGVEAALILGITLAYLAKIGRNDLRRAVFYGMGTAFAASIAVAIALSRLQWNQDIFEGVVMLVASFFVVSMVIYMMRTARKLKGEIEGRLADLAGRSSVIGIFLFVFLMVLREGVETVLILSAVSLNSSQLGSFLGTLLGVAVAVLFGVMFVKGSVRINLQKFFKVTTVILMFVAAQLFISGLHELAENGVLPSNRQEMAAIGPIVRNDVFFFVTILALTAIMVLLEYRRRQPVVAAEVSVVERRKAEWTQRRERFWMIGLCTASFLFITMVTAEFIYAKGLTALSPATPVQFVNGVARIPQDQVSDGDLHRFAVIENGTEVRFLLFKKPDGTLVAVWDACEVCGPVGFFKTSAGIVCKNCNAPVNSQALGQPGGCNPVPLASRLDAGSIVIQESDLVAGVGRFQK